MIPKPSEIALGISTKYELFEYEISQIYHSLTRPGRGEAFQRENFFRRIFLLVIVIVIVLIVILIVLIVIVRAASTNLRT